MRKTRENEVIARTVEQLIMWGFSARGEVFEAVGTAARSVLHRTFADSKTPLGPDRIKQIWEQYRPEGWERYWTEPKPKPHKRRWMFTKAGLQHYAPHASIKELAETLLRNDGKWRRPTEWVWHPLERKWEEEISYRGWYPELSPKWEAQLRLMPKISRRQK